MNISTFAETAFYLWGLSEIIVFMISNRVEAGQLPDMKKVGSFMLILLGMFMTIFVNLILSGMKIGYVNEIISDIGSVLVITGFCFRFWAALVAKKVSDKSKKKVVQDGPYGLIRHPAYTGGLVAVIGIGLAFNTWLGSLIMLLCFIVLSVYRIHKKEIALVKLFPKEYPNYREKTWRFIPYIW